jgi:hypothetical protein
MKTPALAAIVLGLTGASIHGATALEALRKLPANAIDRVAAIVACEGKPTPDRWRFIVWEPDTELGFREYVISDNELVAINTVSQFAGRVTERDVFTPQSIQIDSDKAAAMAMQYAKANNQAIASLQYSLRRTDGAAPTWKLDCLDGADRQVGSICVTANAGKVVARLGFENEPGRIKSTSNPAPAAQRAPKPKIAQRADPVAEAPATEDPVVIRRAVPIRTEPRQGPISRALGSLFRGDD